MRVFGMDMYIFIVGMVISWTILTGFLNAELRHTLIDRYPPPSFSHTEEDTRLLLIESFIWSGAASLIWPITLLHQYRSFAKSNTFCGFLQIIKDMADNSSIVRGNFSVRYQQRVDA